MSKPMVIIDTDCGVDDALAIMLAAFCQKQNKLDIKAITCTHGNTSCTNVTKNVALTLRAMDLKNIKIYKGCESPTIGPFINDEYYGKDGLGDSTKDMPPIDVHVEAEHAVNALIRLAKENHKQITLIALGPLTNIGLAYLMDNQFFDNLRDIVYLGGTIDFGGNMTPAQEFNVMRDPEACHIMLNNAKCPITIVPIECGLTNLLTWDIYDKIIALDNDKAKFVKLITNMEYKRVHPGFKGLIMADTLTVLAFAYQEFIVTKQSIKTSVELNGENTRGQLVLDKRHGFDYQPTKWPNVTFITHFDQSKFMQLLIDFLK
ncbi:inosine-uridine preferring nucleoside hydrolase-like [Oppia nitens]|uniref:inosine-uridine preferring nucleoside hydrolase-like n=1 Tax=Oppia nitens TaxID=1686743 RepID=UPI0023DB4928|nr:inosine-uridine preferring nucleoside hydrolase-like [Oppia nitens]